VAFHAVALLALTLLAGIPSPGAPPTPAPSVSPSHRVTPTAPKRSASPTPRRTWRTTAPPPVSSPPARPVQAAVPIVPGLAIAVDNARDALRTGDLAEYRITVRNDGARAAPLTVTAIVPEGLADVQPADGGTVDGTKVAWTVTVPAGGQATVALAARVAEPPRGHRIALTACGIAEGHRAPQLCGTDLDGVTRQTGIAWLLWLGVGAGSVALAAAALAVRRRFLGPPGLR